MTYIRGKGQLYSHSPNVSLAYCVHASTKQQHILAAIVYFYVVPGVYSLLPVHIYSQIQSNTVYQTSSPN